MFGMFLIGVVFGVGLIVVTAIVLSKRDDKKDMSDDYKLGYEDGYIEGLNDAKFKDGKRRE